MFFSTRMTTPCRTFQSDEDPTSSPYAILLDWTSSLCQGLLKIMHHLFPHQTCAPQTLRTSQATSDPDKPWNSISMDFIEKLPSSSGYTLILVIVDHLSSSHSSFRLTILFSHLNLHKSLFYMSFPSMVSQGT